MEVIEDHRQLIPRWQASKNMAKLYLGQEYAGGKNRFLAKDKDADGFRFSEALSEWNINKNRASAVELYVKSMLTGLENNETKAARDFLLAQSSLLTDPVKKLLAIDVVHSELDGFSEKDFFSSIKRLKSKSKDYPLDSLVWNDLAFYYAAVGNDRKSERCMRIAFDLSKKNALIARAYSRLLVHQGAPDEAIRILKETGATKTNPILLSADISIRSIFKIGSVDVKTGAKLIEKFKDKPLFISELSACIGTLEVESGASKSGKLYLKEALKDPTENTISQLHWLKHKRHINMGEALIPSLEGMVIAHYENGNYEACKNSLLDLHSFQPFSDRPIVDAGYMALVALNNPDEAIRIYEDCSHITKGSFMATNNYIVALLDRGDAQAAYEKLERLHRMIKSPIDEAVYKATKAMFYFKLNRPEIGRMMYEEVASFFHDNRDDLHLGRLYLYYGKEEVNFDKVKGVNLLLQSKKIIEKSKKNKELLSVVSKLLSDNGAKT